jgi:phage tail-like protein
MDADRGFSRLAHPDQWARCRHVATALLDGGGVELNWGDASPLASAGPPAPNPCPSDRPAGPAGLAFDRWCRAYRSRPDRGRVEVLGDGSAVAVTDASSSPQPGILRVPRGLAVDGEQRLYVAEAGAGAVHVVDLWSQRLRRRALVRSRRHPRRRPVDLAATCCGAVALLHDPAGLVRFEGRRGPLAGPPLVRPSGAARLRPRRLAAAGGEVLVLWSSTGAEPAVLASAEGTVLLRVEGATDLDVTADGVLVVARGPGQSFRRFRDGDGGWSEIEPLGARDYDGGAVAVAPDGRVAFTTADGFGWTAGADVNYAPSGQVTSYRLDSTAYRTRWGRVFLDACIPPGTAVAVRFLTTDEDEVDDPLPPAPPARGARTVRSPELTPPLPSRARLAEGPAAFPLHRRATGREWPWAQIAAGDAFETYEAPVSAPPGRYLWMILELSGTDRSTPRVREVRVERPGHRLLGQLPRAWSRQELDAAFLQRFLAPPEGLLRELDERAARRDLLLDPATTPQEALGFLAGLVGIAFDRRWPEAARRALVAEAFSLFRIRGTRACLERIVELYLGRAVQVMESWRLRGLGGTILGAPPGGARAPAVGGAAGTSGGLGRFTVGGALPGQDGYTATAHRFILLVRGELTDEQRDVVADLIEQHKPAHTLGVICELGAGMRVGRQLHAGVTSFVGPGGAFAPAVVGQVLVGGDGVVGLPAVGSRLGDRSTAGEVRVG